MFPKLSQLTGSALNEDTQGSNWREKCGGKNYALQPLKDLRGALTYVERFGGERGIFVLKPPVSNASFSEIVDYIEMKK